MPLNNVDVFGAIVASEALWFRNGTTDRKSNKTRIRADKMPNTDSEILTHLS